MANQTAFRASFHVIFALVKMRFYRHRVTFLLVICSSARNDDGHHRRTFDTLSSCRFASVAGSSFYFSLLQLFYVYVCVASMSNLFVKFIILSKSHTRARASVVVNIQVYQRTGVFACARVSVYFLHTFAHTQTHKMAANRFRSKVVLSVIRLSRR